LEELIMQESKKPITKEQLQGAAIAGLTLSLCGAGLAGWIMNIAAIWTDGGFNGATALRLIGIPFWPLGAILGWLS
jgi:hypothetical protein